MSPPQELRGINTEVRIMELRLDAVQEWMR
jgi:hypothetical protein